ncbi:MAG: MFS transporter [Gemmatimonadales bacterium]|nr:MAG: MFS transporter [Gemmatimonadales bacterium]
MPNLDIPRAASREPLGAFFRRGWPLLGFGLVLAFFSSFGQTFLVSLFVPGMQAEFDLSNARFGALYSAATLGSAFLMPWAGARLDRVRLPTFTLGLVVLMAAAAVGMGSAPILPVLVVALVGIRLAGQGLASHTAMTVMARYHGERRGVALSVAGLGYPLGEALLPLLVLSGIGAVGWRAGWFGVAGVALLVFGPLLWILLRLSGREMDPVRLAEASSEGVDGDPSAAAKNPAGGVGGRAGEGSAMAGGRAADGSGATARDWNRSRVLRDVRFWCVLPAALLPPFWATALFLYQVAIGEAKGWSAALMASAFTAFALTRIAVSLLVGAGVDRWMARRIVPFSLIPMGVGMGLLLAAEGEWGAFAFMAGMGMAVGMGATAKPALWAELYGVRHLGAIKAMVSSLMVVSTAGSPILAGWLLDRDGGLELLLQLGMASVVVGTVLALRILPRRRGTP